MIYGGKGVVNKKQPYLLIYDFAWKKEKKWKEQKLTLDERAQRVSTVRRLQQLQGQNGQSVVRHSGELSSTATPVHGKQKASQFEATTALRITGKASHLVYA